MSSGRKKQRPTLVGEVVSDVLRQKGMKARIDQASVVTDWGSVVGPAISAVTTPISVTPDGILFVAVTTNAWMNELSLMEPELLRALNAKESRASVKRIRWLLRRA
jgi:predicted nucleic acid-binding Zn ribbon protein